jgi:single-stranded-DNA-specific exonuclease
MIRQTWSIVRADELKQQEFVRELGIHPVTAQLLINRDILDVAEAREYLFPTLQSLPDPFLLPDMDVAVGRIVEAIKGKQRIALIGDYDVDGVTSAAILTRFFSSLGIALDVHIPHRLTEGYGLNVDALAKLKERGANLVITVDNGTRSFSEIALAREWGLDVIVTDHHEVGEVLPDAVGVINPKRADSSYPDRELAGCGVAFALCMALRRKLRDLGALPSPEPNLRQYLDLVAIGTVADIVPLRGVNRVLARFGLEEIARTAKPGIRELMVVSGLADPGPRLRAGHVAYRIAPRLNAAGRLGDAYPALECLTTDDAHRARELASLLDRTNAERKLVEERILHHALDEVERVHDPSVNALVVASSGWHPGVVGIVASKIAKLTSKPCAVIACEGGIGKGSVRTAGGIDVVEALSEISSLLDRFGGHSQAAGFTIDVRQIDSFRERFSEVCAGLRLDDSPEVTVDAEVSAQHINDQLIHELSYLEPFGAGNPEPVLCARDLTIVNHTVVGNNHLRLRLDGGAVRLTAIGFDMAKVVANLKDDPHIAFIPQHNTWNGQTTIQLKIKAFLMKE